MTDAGTFEADVLVVALGADSIRRPRRGWWKAATSSTRWPAPSRCATCCRGSSAAPAIIGVSGKSFKCPPAPSETALLLHDYLTARGRREATEISLVMPFGTPIPPSPDTSKAILAAFAERGIRFVKDNLVKALDPARKVAVLSDGTEMPYELFLGMPVHRVPQVVVESGLAARPRLGAGEQEDARDEISRRLRRGRRERRRHAEGGRVRRGLRARRRRGDHRAAPRRPVARGLQRQGSCYVEFGHDQVGRVDVDFLSGPKPTGGSRSRPRRSCAEKKHFGSSRLQRWSDARQRRRITTPDLSRRHNSSIALAFLHTLLCFPGAGGVFADLGRAMKSRRTVAVSLLSFASGLPLGLVWIAIPDWMRDIGVDIRVVGLFSLAQAPWAFKVLWSPLMDRTCPRSGAAAAGG